MKPNRIALLRGGVVENVIVVPADCTPESPGRLRDLFARYDGVAFAHALEGVTIEVDDDDGNRVRAQVGAGDRLPPYPPVRAFEVRDSAAIEAERLELEEIARLEAEANVGDANDGGDGGDVADDADEITPPDFPDEDL